MRTRASIRRRTISIVEAARNFQEVLRAVDRMGFVQLTKNGKARYHIGKEEDEKALLARLEESAREHKEGKTKVLHSLTVGSKRARWCGVTTRRMRSVPRMNSKCASATCVRTTT